MPLTFHHLLVCLFFHFVKLSVPYLLTSFSRALTGTSSKKKDLRRHLVKNQLLVVNETGEVVVLGFNVPDQGVSSNIKPVFGLFLALKFLLCRFFEVIGICAFKNCEEKYFIPVLT